MTTRSAAAFEAVEPIFDLDPQRRPLFPEGTRTGDWLAVGDHERVAPSIPAPTPSSTDLPRVSTGRRTLVRVIGGVAIAGTLLILVSIAMHPSARGAILHWGLFGKGDRIVGHATR